MFALRINRTFLFWVGIILFAHLAVPDALLSQEEGEGIRFKEGVAYALWYRPPMAGLGRIVRSQSGIIYFQHLLKNNRMRISRLNVEKDKATKVVTLKKNERTTIIGGPGDSFFLQLKSDIRQYLPDGSFSVWGTGITGDAFFYTGNGRMLGMGDATTGSVLEIFPDGTTQLLASGFSQIYDVVGDSLGNVYVSDLTAGTIIRVDASGRQKIIANVFPDNPDLGLDADEKLYVNNVGNGFVRIDISSGALTPVAAGEDISMIVKTPADFVFEDSGRVVFATWTDSSMSWYDPNIQAGGVLQHKPWTNTDELAVGPDDLIYMSVPGYNQSPPSKIVRFSEKAKPETHVTVNGTVGDIAFDAAGGLYYVVTQPMSVKMYYLASGTDTPLEIPIPLGYDLNSITVDPVTGHVLAATGFVPQDPSRARIMEISRTVGQIRTYGVKMPKKTMGLSLEASSNGTLYASTSEEKRFTTGPCVNRWILRLNLDKGTSQVVLKKDRIGCCPAISMSMDFKGIIWWILNPDFLLYRIDPSGIQELYGSNLPVDSGAFVRNREGQMFLNSPEGIYRVWELSTRERLQPVLDEIDQMVTEEIFTRDQADALQAKLGIAISKLDKGMVNGAIRKLKAYLALLDEFEKNGLLTKERADVIRDPVESLLAQLQAG